MKVWIWCLLSTNNNPLCISMLVHYNSTCCQVATFYLKKPSRLLFQFVILLRSNWTCLHLYPRFLKHLSCVTMQVSVKLWLCPKFWSVMIYTIPDIWNFIWKPEYHTNLDQNHGFLHLQDISSNGFEYARYGGPSSRFGAPSQYKDYLFQVWGFPCER